MQAPLAPGENTSGQRKYKYIGGFDTAKVSALFAEKFKHIDRYDARSLPNLLTLLALIEADPQMGDLRWIAYMLATAYWETSHTEVEEVARTDKKGNVLKDKLGKVITRKKKFWVNMAPIVETGGGAGRKYERPVKVFAMPSGEVQITEADGDQWILNSNAVPRPVLGPRGHRRRVPVLGVESQAAQSDIYTSAEGDERKFIGRGYVQLTWWSGYAQAGVDLGKGLTFFLDDPERALEITYAYALMSLGMREGKGFANRRKFDDYFSGNSRDYCGARAMVNANDTASIAPIAQIAELFEDILWEARKAV